MEYRIVLQRMEFRALHGCYELERKVGNRFTVDLEITACLGDAAAEDSVEQTVNYLTVYEVVSLQMRITQRTIERVAMNIIEAVYASFRQVRHVKCTVSKLAPPLGGKLEKVSGKKIHLTQKTDPTVLAGLRVEMEGKQLDGTVQGRISDISKKLDTVVV